MRPPSPPNNSSHEEIERLLEAATDPKAATIVFEKLGYRRPEQLANLFFNERFGEHNILSKSSFPRIAHILNLGMESFADQVDKIPSERSGSHIGFNPNRNRHGVRIQLTHMKIFAFLVGHLGQEVPFRPEHIRRAWFVVTPSKEGET